MKAKNRLFLYVGILILFCGNVSPIIGCEVINQISSLNLNSPSLDKCRNTRIKKIKKQELRVYDSYQKVIANKRYRYSLHKASLGSANSIHKMRRTKFKNREQKNFDHLSCVELPDGKCLDDLSTDFPTPNSQDIGFDSSENDIFEENDTLPKISVLDAMVIEGDIGSSQLIFKVTLDSFANGYVDADYSTSDGTATSLDNDYTPVSGRLTIPPGYTSTKIVVNVKGDKRYELDETFDLIINNISSNASLAKEKASGTILNEDLANQTELQLPYTPRGVISHGRKARPINQGILDHPNISGFLVLQGWNEIESTEGYFKWDHIDSEVARARAAGKVIRLAIHAGGDSAPGWIFQNYPEVKKIIWYDKITGELIWIPAFWDPVYIEIKRRFYEAVGNRYQDEETVFAMSASMADPNTGDWAFVIKDDAQQKSYLDAGFTEEVFIDAFKKVIDYAMASFKNKYVATAVGPIPRLLVNDKLYAVHQVLDYAYDTYGDRLIIMKGALHAATPDPSLSSGTQWETMLKYTPNTAAQFVWSVTRDPDYKMNGKVPYGESQITEIFRRTVDTAQNYDFQWIEPWGIDILNPFLAGEIEYAANVLRAE